MPEGGSPYGIRIAGLAAPEFVERYNKASFVFEHELCQDPTFQLESLAAIAHRQGSKPGFAYCSMGAVDASDRWEKGVAEAVSVSKVLEEMAASDALIMLRHVEQDPVVGPIVSGLLARIVSLMGPRMRDDVIVGRATILVASPRRITSYHMDADTNFLFQIAGRKTFRVFDQTNRDIVTERELENFHGGDANGAILKDHAEANATIYEFCPGSGIHIPSLAPHWAQNGQEVSIALSLNYDLRSMQRIGRVYAINRRIRRFGLRPSPPGRSGWRDSIKLAVAATVDQVKSTRRPAAPEPAFGWAPDH